MIPYCGIYIVIVPLLSHVLRYVCFLSLTFNNIVMFEMITRMHVTYLGNQCYRSCTNVLLILSRTLICIYMTWLETFCFVDSSVFMNCRHTHRLMKLKTGNSTAKTISTNESKLFSTRHHSELNEQFELLKLKWKRFNLI